MNVARIKSGARLAAVWIPTLFLVFVFAPQAWNKLSDTGGWAIAFRHWGYPTWFRILIGFVETSAALLLLWPRSAIVGAALIIAVSNTPGAIATTRMPKRASSRTAGSVMAATPPLEAEYAACPI